MKFKKAITATAISIGLISVSVSPASAKEQNVSYYQAVNKAIVYNQKGKKTDGWMKKGMVFRTLGTKKIKGKKYYIVGKKRYVLAKDLVKFDSQPTPNLQQPWQSKHLVDNEVGLVTQIKKAFTLQGEDRLEADKEIAVQLNMSPDSVTVSNQAEFEKKLQSYVGSNDSAKSWIEQGGK